HARLQVPVDDGAARQRLGPHVRPSAAAGGAGAGVNRGEATDTLAHPAAWYALPQPLFLGSNDAQLLLGGDEYFVRLIEAVDNALHEVWLATYIFHDD